MTRASTVVVALLAFSVALAGAHVAAQQGMKGSGSGAMGGQMGSGGHGMMGMGTCPMMGGNADMPTFGEGRIAFLKAELAITSAQQSVWDAYTTALRKNFASMHSMHQKMSASMESKTPVERLDAHLTAMKGRHATLEEIKPALAALYAALSGDQKKKADSLLTGMGCMM